MLLGILKITYDDKFVSHDRVSQYTRPGVIVRLKGTISDLPVVRRQSVGWVVEAESVAIFGNYYPASGGVLVTMRRNAFSDDLLDSLTYGRSVSLS
jgi:hypothetical protein